MRVALNTRVKVSMSASDKYLDKMLASFRYFSELASGEETDVFQMWSDLKVDTRHATCGSKEDEKMIRQTVEGII